VPGGPFIGRNVLGFTATPAARILGLPFLSGMAITPTRHPLTRKPGTHTPARQAPLLGDPYLNTQLSRMY